MTRFAIAVLLVLGSVAWGQGGGSPGAGGAPSGGPLALIEEANRRVPSQRLGLRASVFRAAGGVVPTVVVVETPAQAAEAIARWGGPLRYPVLIDDGSGRAAEDIARFVRAFEPDEVVRWTPEVESPPEDPAEWQRWLLTRHNRAIGMSEAGADQQVAVDDLKRSGFGVNGVVVVDPEDEAWIAGLALSAGRIQVLVFADGPGGVGAVGQPEAVERMASAVTAQLDGYGLSWRGLGDDIDAVTLAMDTFTRIDDGGYRGENTETSVTDRFARADPPNGPRWAWTGLMHGGARESLYRAMCGLFLPIESAWMFDGYVAGPPWNAFDFAPAATQLDRMGVETTVFTRPANNALAWQRATAGGLLTDLVMINSKGRPTNFDLLNDTVPAGEVPFLRSPAVGLMVHSFSTANPARETTVAGRWLAHGAYAWYGSVQEPFLNAFMPWNDVGQRVAAGLPMSAAVSFDNAPAWKLLYLGDPLITVQNRAATGSRVDEPLPLDDAASVDEAMSLAVRSADFAGAVRALVMLGRDAQASRLARALLKDRPEAVTPEVAALVVLPLVREGFVVDALRAFEQADERSRRDVTRLDALWHGARALRPDRYTRNDIDILAANLRTGQWAEDALTVGVMMKAKFDGAAAGAYLTALAGRMQQAGPAAKVREYAGEFLSGRR